MVIVRNILISAELPLPLFKERKTAGAAGMIFSIVNGETNV
jgi:hypothetical protein